MILKGSTIRSVQHARQFARHLLKPENTVIEYWQSLAGDESGIEADLVDMQLLTNLTRGKTGIFHVAIAPRSDEPMTADQWERSVEIIEEAFALEGQLRTQVYHVKKSRPHVHVFFSMVDIEHEKLKRINNYKLRLMEAGRQMELEFGLSKTRQTANEYTIRLSHADRMEQQRTGKNPKKRKELLTRLWHNTDESLKFMNAVAAHDYFIIKGDRCRYGLLYKDGTVYNLVRQLPKVVRLKEVEGRLGEVRHLLMEVEEAREHLRKEREKEQARIKARVERQVERIRGRQSDRER